MSRYLPKGWAETTLDEIIELNPKNDLEDNKEAGFVPMAYVPLNMKDKVRYDRKKWGEIKKGYTHFRDGDVIVAKITPCFENGKSTILKNLPNGFGSGSTEYFVLRPFSDSIHPFLLLAIVKSSDFIRNGTALMTGSVGHRRLPKNYVQNYRIFLPPRKEQDRIAAKLDSLLASVDACKARLDKVPEILKRFRQSVLADATSGKLTEDWRRENEVSQDVDSLLKAVRIGKKKHFQKKLNGWKLEREKTKADKNSSPQKPRKANSLPPLSSKELEKLPKIPSSWRWVKNETYAFEVKDGTHYTPKYIPNGIPFVTQKNIREKGFDLNNVKYISEKDHNIYYKRSNVEKKDILISMIGHNRGMCCIVDTEAVFSIKNVGLVKLFNHLQINKYLLCYYQSKTGQDAILKQSKGGAQAFIGLTELRHWPVPICPIEEQKEIVRRVEALFSIADQLETKLTLARKRVDNLTASILSKAFRGKLVPQDPKDEPAEKLLERIRAERESLGAGTKKGSRTTQKKSAQTEKGKTSSADLVKEPQPATAVGPSKTKAIAPNADPKKTTPSKAERQIDEFEVPQAFRKAIFRKNGIDEAILLKLAGERLGIENLTHETRKELAPYIDTALQRKILCRKGDGFSSGAPTIQRYDDEFLMKVVETVIENGYEYQADHLINESANYLGFERVSDAFKKRMNSVLDMAVRKKVLYRKDAYLGKVE